MRLARHGRRRHVALDETERRQSEALVTQIVLTHKLHTHNLLSTQLNTHTTYASTPYTRNVAAQSVRYARQGGKVRDHSGRECLRRDVALERVRNFELGERNMRTAAAMHVAAERPTNCAW